MKKKYIEPECLVFDIAANDIICDSYGTISTGGDRTDHLDAAPRRSEWRDYEQY